MLECGGKGGWYVGKGSATASGGPDLTRGVHAGTVQGQQGQSILVKKVQNLYFSLQCQVFVCLQIGVLYRGHSRI